jgi:cell division septation protein DedD
MAAARKKGDKPAPKGKKNGSAKKAPRKFTLELSTGGLIAAGFGALLCLIWVFVLGVLLGRGYRPENDVPELSRFIPEPPAADIATDARPALKDNEVLKAEELDYMKSLHQKPPEPSRREKPKPKPKPVPKASSKTPREVVRKAAVCPPSSTTTSSPKGMYDYTYQVAAFQERTSAAAFTRRLKKRGLRPGTESVQVGGKTWIRVLVHFRGRPEETARLKDVLQSMGISRVIMRGKTPI